MMDAIAALTDAFRFWGALAGVIGLVDIFSGRHNGKTPPWSGPATQVGVCTFLIIMGLLLPLGRRDIFEQGDPIYRAVIMAAWYILAVGGWAAIAKASAQINYMRGASWLSLGLCLAASFATAK